MMRRLSPVDRRLASRAHQWKIEASARAEAVADYVGRQVDRLAARIKALVAGGLSPWESHRIAVLWRAFPFQVTATIDDMLERMVRWGYRAGSTVLLDSIPISWWKVVLPTLPIPAMETENPNVKPDPSILRATDFFMDPHRVSVTFEPVVPPASVQRMTAAVEALLFPALERAAIRNIVRTPEPYSGKTWAERLADLSRKVANPERLANELVTSIALGEPQGELVKRVDKLVGPLHGTSKMIARNEAARVAEAANKESWQALGELQAGVQVIAVLDERTRPEHAARSGRIYWNEGTPNVRDAPNPPYEADGTLAYNCRCTLAPVLAPPGDVADNPALQAAFRNADGDFAPDPAAYDVWFRNADKRRQMAAVGVRRYAAVEKLVRRRPEYSDFVDEDGKLLSVAALRSEKENTRLARKAAVSIVMRRQENYLRQVALQGFLNP